MASIDTPDDQLVSVNYGDHEPDDWASKHQISLSELASRLNAKQHYDNRGRQIWTDGAEEATVQWNVLLAGGGGVARSLLCAWRRAASVQLSQTGAALDMAGLTKTFYNPQTGRYGVEIAWSCDNAVLTTFFFYIVVYTGPGYWRGMIGYDAAVGQYFYTDDLGANIGTGQVPVLNSDRHYWHKMKLVIDVDNTEYVRALFDGQEHNLTGIPLQWFGIAGGPQIDVYMQIMGHATTPYNVYLDDFILTHLEP